MGAKVCNVSSGVLADNEHGAQVALRAHMVLESVLVAALFLADLTEPAQALQAFRLHRIGDLLGRAHFAVQCESVHGLWQCT